MLLFLLYVLFGLVLLYFGAEGLVRGSSSLALRLRVSPLVIGLTVVAYGTSMPEMVVSTKTALSHQGGIAIGNVIGSNIFNIAVILGISALISPLKIKAQIVRTDAPIMVAASFLFLLLFRNFRIDRLEGVLLFSLVIIYTVGNFYFARRESKKFDKEFSDTFGMAKYKSFWIELLFILVGLGLLVIGANSLVNGAVGIARHLQVSEAVIGLTIIAAGTSLPELATSLVAAARKEADIAVGNIIGSNLFNILAILGAASLIAPIDGIGISSIDTTVMIGVSILLLPMMRSGFRISRWEGGLLISIYGAYLVYLLGK
ncbi:MAG: calcium/sodium antiporter [Calditrichaeota bacterium]|nr:MAG: calcium/sodium antiporter [Calditrichota bacterium]